MSAAPMQAVVSAMEGMSRGAPGLRRRREGGRRRGEAPAPAPVLARARDEDRSAAARWCVPERRYAGRPRWSSKAVLTVQVLGLAVILLVCRVCAATGDGTRIGWGLGQLRGGQADSGDGGAASRLFRGSVRDGAGGVNRMAMKMKAGKKEQQGTLLNLKNPLLKMGRSHERTSALDERKRWLYMTDDYLAFEIEGEDQFLVMERGPDSADGVKIDVLSREEIGLSSSAKAIESRIPVDGIYGIYDLESGPHVAFITKSETKFVDRERKIELRKVSTVSVLPILKQPLGLTEAQEREVLQDLDLLRLAFASHHLYFSPSYDVTHSFQRSTTEPLSGWQDSDERFFWNRGVLAPLTDFCEEEEELRQDLGGRIVQDWIVPVMSAFVQVEENCTVGDHSFTMLFVSRRSCYRQGTRYTKRGIDEAGNVANFVETEQAIFHATGDLTSHVQIRGSIPLFWSSPVNLSYHPPVKIGEDDHENAVALRRHAEALAGSYSGNKGSIVFVNLIDKKKDQGLLGDAFERALLKLEEEDKEAGLRPDLPELEHVWFDFHHECRNMQWQNLDKLLAEVDDAFVDHGYFHLGPDGDVVGLQDGVIRTNCMDCLDRTNVVQSIIARRSLLVQLHAVGQTEVKIPEKDSDLVKLDLEGLAMPAEELEKRFRNVWGNNADEIAVLYAGTPALKGDFTRTGKRTRFGILQDGTNSALRYVMNNFRDHRRQEAVDLLLGRRLHAEEIASIRSPWERGPIDLDVWTRISSDGNAPLLGSIKAKAGMEISMKSGDEEEENSVIIDSPFGPVDVSRSLTSASIVGLCLLAIGTLSPAGRADIYHLRYLLPSVLLIPLVQAYWKSMRTAPLVETGSYLNQR